MRLRLLFVFMALVAASSCKTPDERAAEALARRVMGEKASAVTFEQTDAKEDSYELVQKGSKVLIKGNNANSMAVGLNRYLQEYCLANVSWYDFNPVELPAVMPSVPEKVTGSARVPIRFFLNYCTFGYTLPWWKWEQWERFIDWMALNGVNMPLAITGEEAVWQKVWRKYGLTDQQIRAYFTGPAHLPWQRMINIDAWQGPLPQTWIDGQAKLQKRILRRERELGMTPVLPGFSGHVPAGLADGVPQKMDTTRVGSWCDFADEYRCTFLNPSDPLFAQIQKDFLEEQTRMYGTDHVYGVDLFNEVDPPSWDPDTLARISAGVFDSMTAVDPDAVWLQMGWLFVSNPGQWTPERIKAYLTAVPQGRMILLDYESDYVQIWKQTESFYGQKFIWCYLGNFGGMTEIEGDYHLNARRIAETLENGGPGFVGVGSTLEGFGVNEPVYEAVLDQAWNTGRGLEEYIDNIADRHLGRKDLAFRAYWHQLVDKVSITHTSTSSSSIIVAHPSLEGRWNWTTYFEKAYDIAEMEKALEMIEGVEDDSDYYRFDLANARRQALRNRALPVRERFTAAYRAGDRAGMVAARDEFLSICDQLVAVLETRPEFSLSDWIQAAREWGQTPEEKDYFERNARTIITVWGDTVCLSDYANRDWDALVESFYKVRWRMFFDAVLAAFDAGQPFLDKGGPLDNDIRSFELRWVTPQRKGGGARPEDLIPAPAMYAQENGCIPSARLSQMEPVVKLSEKKLRKRLEGQALAGWQLKQAYWLEIGKKGVKVEAADEQGAFYALQSLQMLTELADTVSCCTILDWPRFQYRGVMLDVSRNFFGKDFIKKQMEMMARLKLNRFHFHLVDNPGWRLQIDAYPRLTQLTAWRPEADFWDWEKNETGGDFVEEGTPGAYGGYFTKDDIRELLAFAAERHIEVIPEIEMPGHNYETRAAYPELACALPAAERPDEWELCPGKEDTYEFLEKVLLEVFDLFPSQYVHIGGDEAGKDNWARCPDCQARMKAEGMQNVEELQSYMIKRMERFAQEHGKRIIGWDEILEGGLAPDATVMSWRGTEGGMKAIAAGHDVIFTPGKYCYLDHHQGPQYRPAGPLLSLEQAYSYDPLTEVSEADAHHVLGLQGNLWTEWVHENWHAEMQLYPRVFAIAETAWSQPSCKDWPDFQRRSDSWTQVARSKGYTVYPVPDRDGK